MQLELVGGGGDGGGLEEAGEFGLGEVGDADCSAFAGRDELFHCFVGLGRVVSVLVGREWHVSRTEVVIRLRSRCRRRRFCHPYHWGTCRHRGGMGRASA